MGSRTLAVVLVICVALREAVTASPISALTKSRHCLSLKGGIGLLVPEELRSGKRNPKEGAPGSTFSAKQSTPVKDGVYLDSPLARILGLTSDGGEATAATLTDDSNDGVEKGGAGQDAKAKSDATQVMKAGEKAKEEEETKKQREAEENANQQEQAAKLKEEAENKAKEEEATKAKEQAEKKAKQEAEKSAMAEAERKAKQEAETKAKQEAETKAKAEAEMKAKEEAEMKAKAEAEKKAKPEAETKAKASAEAEMKSNADAEIKAKAEAETKAKEDAEKNAKLETVEKAKAEAEKKAKEEAETKAKQEAEKKAKEEAETKAKQEAEKKAKEEAETKAKQEAEKKAKEEAETKAKAEAEKKAKEEAETKAKQEAEKKAKEEAATKAKQEAEKKAKEEAETKAKQEAEKKAKAETETKAKAEAEKKAKEEAETKAKQEAEKKAKEEAETKAKQEAEKKAKEEAATKAKQEAEKKAKEEAETKAKQEAEKKAKAETETKAKAEAEKKAKEAEKKAKEETEKKAKAETEAKLAAGKTGAKQAAPALAESTSGEGAGGATSEVVNAPSRMGGGSTMDAAQFPTYAVQSKLPLPADLVSNTPTKSDQEFRKGVEAVAALASLTPTGAGMGGGEGGGGGAEQGAMFDELERELHGIERDLTRAEEGEEEGFLGGRGARVNRCSQFLQQLPDDVSAALAQLRVKDDKVKQIQTDYRKQLSALRLKYNKLLAPVLADRRKIVKGKDAQDDKAVATTPLKLRGGPDSWIMAELPRVQGCRGVPDFWLTVMSRSRAVAWRVTARDIPVLRSLSDVRCIEFEGSPPIEGITTRGGFRLEFDFAPNRFLTNTTLTKEYWLNEEDSDVLELPVGCDVAWQPGCNPGQIGSHTVASFFDIFQHTSPRPAPDSTDKELRQREMQLEDDFDIGLAFRFDLVPAALRWYTAEMPADSDDEPWDDLVSSEMV